MLGRTGRCFTGLFVACFCFLGASPSAMAQEADANEARDRFLRGQTAYQEGNYDRAIEEWQAAYAIDPRSRILYNLSQAFERAGRIVEAIRVLEDFLSRIEDGDPVRETAIARLASMKERLRRTGIRVTGAPEGAEILVDDESWGLAPRPDAILVEPGPHKVELRLEGHKEFRAQVLVPAGETVEVAVEMAQEGESRMPLILVSSGGGLVIAAVVVGAMGLAKAKDSPYSSGGAADTARRMAISADVLGAVGGAALIGGGVWWLVQRKSRAKADEEPSSLSLTPSFSKEFVGIHASLGF
jgi:hypothetical protein